MSVSDRLKEYCKKNGITQESLVVKGFGTKQTINNYINGNTEPKAGFLENFIHEFRLSAKWLMTGEEEIYQNLGPPGGIEDRILNDSEKKYGCEMCAEKERHIKTLEYTLELQRELLRKEKSEGEKFEGVLEKKEKKTG